VDADYLRDSASILTGALDFCRVHKQFTNFGASLYINKAQNYKVSSGI